jgi:hypothetical protein
MSWLSVLAEWSGASRSLEDSVPRAGRNALVFEGNPVDKVEGGAETVEEQGPQGNAVR